MTRQIKVVLALFAIACIPLWFGGKGLFAFLSGDDMMNLYGYWNKPVVETWQANLLYFSAFYRPLGGLFYLGMHSAFGLNPLPYRIGCFVLLLLNLVLVYRLALVLRASKEIALLTALFGSHHGGYADYYYNTGVIYDLLCYTFFVLGLYWHVSAKRGPLWVIFAFICALNSKEMALVFPGVILLYELVFHGLNWKRLRLIPVLGLMLVPYVIFKLSAASSFAGVGNYKLNLSVAQYLSNNLHYLNLLLYQPMGWATPLLLASVVAGMFALALLWRSKILLFCSFFVLITPLPIIFIDPRGTIFVLYIPMIGYSLFVATILVLLRDKLLGAARFRPLLFASSLALFVWIHARNLPAVQEDSKLGSTTVQLTAMHLQPKRGARLLFLDDPFDKDEYTLLFICRLLYNDHEMEPDRLKVLGKMPPEDEMKAYQYVLAYDKTNGLFRLAGR